MKSFLITEKEIIDINPNILWDPLLGLLSDDRCPNCSFRLYQNSFINQWCPNCGYKNYLRKEKRNDL